MDQTGYARVTRVYEDSPAQEAGIVVGDYITAIDGTDVKLSLIHILSCYTGSIINKGEPRMRLDKYLAETAQCTRSEAKAMLSKGRVQVNLSLIHI